MRPVLNWYRRRAHLRRSREFYAASALRMATFAVDHPDWFVSTPTETFGSPAAGYVLATASLPPAPLVYSFGIGSEISFDLAVIERANARVFAFDPTTESARYIRSIVDLPAAFHFVQLGIAADDGQLMLYDIQPASVHYRPATILTVSGAGGSIGEFRSLESIMKTWGHDRVDVLKLDVEGAEFAVLNALSSDIIEKVGQLVLEFHPHLLNRQEGHELNDDFGWSATRKCIKQLVDYGFRICHLSKRGTEFSFVREYHRI